MGATRVGKARTATVAATGPLARAHDRLLIAGWRWRWHGWPIYITAGAWLLAALAHVAHLRLVLVVALIVAWLIVGGAAVLDGVHPRFFHYATAVLVWTVYASLVGPWRPTAGWVALVTLLPCSINWWMHLRPRHDDPDPVPVLAIEWLTYVAVKILPGTWLEDIHADGDATKATIVFPREAGLTWRAAREKTEALTVGLGKDAGAVVIDEHPAGLHLAQMTLFPTNPLATSRPWPGPTFDPATGVLEVGVYTDGTRAGLRCWSGHGATHGLVVGLTGTGKSAFFHTQIREDYDSGVVVPILLDPQSGQSAPEWTGYIPTVHGVEDCVTALEAISRHVILRSEVMGRLRLKKYTTLDLDKHGLLPLDVICDEFPRLAKHPTLGARAVQAADTIAALGRKAGVRLVVAGQSPLLSEFGAGTALRENLDAGGALMFRLGGVSSGAAIGGPLSRDAATIPQYLRGRIETNGFAYLQGVDGRSALLRTWDPSTIPGPDQAGPAKPRPEVVGITAGLIESFPKPRTGDEPEVPTEVVPPPPAPDVVRPDDGARGAILDVTAEYAANGEHVTTAILTRELAARWGYSASTVTVNLSQLRNQNIADPSAGIARVAHGVYTIPAPITLPTQRSDS